MPRRRLLLSVVALASLLAAAAAAQPVVREGRGENELVLIHGLGADASIWDNVSGFLRGSMQVYAYELHGHGTTPPLPQATIGAEAAALGEWLHAKDVVYPTLVGHGLGGMIALQYALDHPADVRRVILIDATPRQLASPEDKEELSKALLADYDHFIATRYFMVSKDDAIARKAVDMALRTDSTTFASLLLSSFDWDVSKRLAGFAVPMLVVASENFLPESGYEQETLTSYGFGMARTLHYRKLPGTGHYLMLEKPSQLASLILVYARQDDLK
jgi:pimeloyl-ACP methyl ester carboxylesterase